MNIWQILEIDQTNDLAVIKRAYAAKLKVCKPETDPDGFKQLRMAYELAQQFAKGEKVAESIDAVDPSTMNTQPQNATDSFFDPINTANYLLDELIQDERNAAALLAHLNENKYFDNPDYLETFLEVLVINLLSLTPTYYNFVCYLIREFDLVERAKRPSNNRYYMLALNNLISNSRPYDYIQKLHFYSRIENEREAKEKEIDWEDCCAAKILFSPLNYGEFVGIVFFNAKRRKAILSHLNYIEKNFPQAIGLGLNIQTVAWWNGVNKVGFAKYILANIMLLALAPVKFFANFFSMIFRFLEININVVSPLTVVGIAFLIFKYYDASISKPSNYVATSALPESVLAIPIKKNKSEVALQVNVTKPAEAVLLEYGPGAEKITRVDESKIDDPIYFPAFTSKILNKHISKKHLEIENIFLKTFKKKLEEAVHDNTDNPYKDITISVKIEEYGLKYYDLKQNELDAVLSVSIDVKSKNTFLAQGVDFSYKPVVQGGFLWSDITSNFTSLKSILENASDRVGDDIILDLKAKRII